MQEKKCSKRIKKKERKENERKNVDEMEKQKEKLKNVKSMKNKDNALAMRRWNKVIKEKVMVIIKKEKK